MKRIATLVALAAFLAALVPALPEAAATEKTIQGELVDSKCFLGGKKHGARHKNCAIACAKNGVPLGISTPDGDYYTLLIAAPDLAEYAALQVKVTGMVDEENHTVIPMGVEVEKDGRWEKVELPEAMM